MLVSVDHPLSAFLQYTTSTARFIGSLDGFSCAACCFSVQYITTLRISYHTVVLFCCEYTMYAIVLVDHRDRHTLLVLPWGKETCKYLSQWIDFPFMLGLE